MKAENGIEVAAIVRGLGDSHAVLTGLVGSIPPELLDRKRGEETWSIAEHVAHLADVQPMLADRMRRILQEDTPEFVPFFPDADEEQDVPELPTVEKALTDFKAGRDAILSLLGRCSGEDWNRLAVHPEYDQYGLYILARHILMHDHWHMYRIEELWLTKDEYLTRVE